LYNIHKFFANFFKKILLIHKNSYAFFEKISSKSYGTGISDQIFNQLAAKTLQPLILKGLKIKIINIMHNISI